MATWATGHVAWRDKTISYQVHDSANGNDLPHHHHPVIYPFMKNKLELPKPTY